MTFNRAKPLGWTNDVEPITATQINQIDANLARAIDGSAGGTYSPFAPIVVGNAGMSISDLVLTGEGTYTGDAKRTNRLDTSTLSGVVSTGFHDPGSRADVYVMGVGAPAANAEFTINLTDNIEGETLMVTWNATQRWDATYTASIRTFDVFPRIILTTSLERPIYDLYTAGGHTVPLLNAWAVLMFDSVAFAADHGWGVVAKSLHGWT